mgnify:CR=1 FL=1
MYFPKNVRFARNFPLPYIYQVANRRRAHKDVFINTGTQRPMRAPGASPAMGASVTRYVASRRAWEPAPPTHTATGTRAEATRPTSSATLPMRAGGMLSMTNHPRSSRTPAAVLRPAAPREQTMG